MDQSPHNPSFSDAVLVAAITASNEVYRDVIGSVRASQRVIDAIEQITDEFFEILDPHCDLQFVPAADIRRMLHLIPNLLDALTDAEAFIAEQELRIHNHSLALGRALEAVAGCPYEVELVLSSAVAFFDLLLRGCNERELSSGSLYDELEALYNELLSEGIEPMEPMDITGYDSEY